MFKTLLVIFTMVVNFSANAGTAQVEGIIGACKAQLEEEIQFAKQDFVKSSIWNYDNDYDVSDVVVGEVKVAKNDWVKVDVYFDIEPNANDLEDASYTYFFKPIFTDATRTECDFVNVDGPAIN